MFLRPTQGDSRNYTNFRLNGARHRWLWWGGGGGGGGEVGLNLLQMSCHIIILVCLSSEAIIARNVGQCTSRVCKKCIFGTMNEDSTRTSAVNWSIVIFNVGHHKEASYLKNFLNGFLNYGQQVYLLMRMRIHQILTNRENINLRVLYLENEGSFNYWILLDVLTVL